jgi:hypothetical protein
MMKPILYATLALVFTAAAHAATTITETFTNTTGSVIPDGDLSGLVQTLTPPPPSAPLPPFPFA